MLHLNRLSLSWMVLPNLGWNLPLALCVMIIGRLTAKTISPFWKTLCLTFLLRPSRFELDTTQYVVKLVVASHLRLRALEDVTDHCLLLSFWSLKRLVMTASGFLTVWLLRIHLPGKKAYCLSGFELWFGRPKDIHQASHSSLVYLMKWILFDNYLMNAFAKPLAAGL